MDSGYDSGMKLREWERDVINRQRNIVFPDTVLNEARFYRHIIRFKMSLNPVQRVGVLALGALAMVLGLSLLAYAVITLRDYRDWPVGFATGGFSLGTLILGFLLAYRAFTAASAPRPPRWWLRQRSRRP
jgi:hypothetical protein